jgi:hypothetical protein
VGKAWSGLRYRHQDADSGSLLSSAELLRDGFHDILTDGYDRCLPSETFIERHPRGEPSESDMDYHTCIEL